MNLPENSASGWPRAVLFDLLTALLNSWTVWNSAAGSEEQGRRWRAEYLRLTYGCGAYVAYEDLVREAALNTGLSTSACQALETRWVELPVWSGVQAVLQEVRTHCKLAVVTNCSRRLGQVAADRVGVAWDVVVTSEEAGFYKPDPRPYRLALQKLEVPAVQAAFVAGSGYDLFGTSSVGLRTYWHNRIGLSLPTGAPPPEVESPTLDGLLPWLAQFRSPASAC